MLTKSVIVLRTMQIHVGRQKVYVLLSALGTLTLTNTDLSTHSTDSEPSFLS